MVWHNLRMYIHESQNLPGAPPPGPPAGALPLHPARGPKAGPWTPPKIGSRLRARSAHMFAPPKKSARAYALAMCAPRTCLPKKNRLALRARYVRYAHMFAPPTINRCPLLCPPHFLNPGAATGPCTNLLQLDAERQSQLKHTPFSLIFGPS